MVSCAPPVVAHLPVFRLDWEILAKLTSTRSKPLDLDTCPAPTSLHRFYGAMGLGHKGPSPPPCPDRDQSPQSRGSGPHCQRLYNGHGNQGSPLPENRTPTRGSDSLWHHSGGMHHCLSLFLYIGAASGSSVTASPMVWKLPHSLTEQRLKIYNESAIRDPARTNPNQSLVHRISVM
jgi:hypothetical protein